MSGSQASWLASLPPGDQATFWQSLTLAELRHIEHDWAFWGRPEQQMPVGTDWDKWLILAGRGWGKTRSGAEAVRTLVQRGYKRIAIVGATAADARDVLVEGESGILAVHPEGDRPLYEPSKRRITWPNGALATTYSADEPDRLRGPQHDAALLDEIAAWQYPETYDMLMMGLRLGSRPLAIITTTPRPIKIIREMMQDPRCTVTRGATMDNAQNLAPQFISQILRKYDGTRLGRQELYAEILEDVPGALWERAEIDAHRIRGDAPTMARVVVAIDPAATSGEDADETGIIVAGIDRDGHGHVLADHSGRYKPDVWAKKVVELYHHYHADRVIAEINNGGEMVEHTLRVVDKNVAYRGVHASRGKVVRAEPISALYEQGRVSHVGSFPTLEDQMCAFTTDLDRDAYGSPDRVDALVWAFSELMVKREPMYSKQPQGPRTLPIFAR